MGFLNRQARERQLAALDAPHDDDEVGQSSVENLAFPDPRTLVSMGVTTVRQPRMGRERATTREVEVLVDPRNWSRAYYRVPGNDRLVPTFDLGGGTQNGETFTVAKAQGIDHGNFPAVAPAPKPAKRPLDPEDLTDRERALVNMMFGR